MKRILNLFIFLLSTTFIFAQSANLNVALKYQISNPGSSGTFPTFTVSGFVSDDLVRWDATNVSVGDSLYVLNGSDLAISVITTINSAAGNSLNITVTCVTSGVGSLDPGQAAIVHPTSIHKLPTFVSGLRDDLRSAIMNRFSQLVDFKLKDARQIAFTSGLTPPANTVATIDGYKLAKNNSGDGDLYKWDGSAWILDGSVVTDATLTGDGSSGNPLAWTGAFVNSPLTGSGTTLVPLGIANNSITATHIAADAVNQSELAPNAVGSSEIIDGTIALTDLAFTPLTTVSTDATLSGNGTAGTPLKIAQQGATSGQVLKWNGSTWLPATDDTGGGGGGGFYQTVQEEGVNLTQRNNLNFQGSAITATDDIGTNSTIVATDSDLNALASTSTNGLYARTGTGTSATRSLVAPAAGFTITNSDGVAGNPTFALSNDIGAIEALVSNGILVRTAANTWALRSIAAGTGNITITEPLGAAGNMTINNTDPDQSVTNEVLTVSDGVNSEALGGQTLTVSGAGGVSTNYNSATNVLTITGSGGGNGIYGGSGTVPTSTTATLTNQFTLGTSTSPLGGTVPFRINVSTLASDVEFMTLRNSTDSLIIQKNNDVYQYFSNVNTSFVSPNISLNAPTVKFNSYANTRNDTGVPVNVLTTDASGNLLSHPVSELPAGTTYTASNGVVLSGSDFQLDLAPLASATPASGDLIPFADISNSNIEKTATISNVIKTDGIFTSKSIPYAGTGGGLTESNTAFQYDNSATRLFVNHNSPGGFGPLSSECIVAGTGIGFGQTTGSHKSMFMGTRTATGRTGIMMNTTDPNPAPLLLLASGLTENASNGANIMLINSIGGFGASYTAGGNATTQGNHIYYVTDNTGTDVNSLQLRGGAASNQGVIIGATGGVGRAAWLTVRSSEGTSSLNTTLWNNTPQKVFQVYNNGKVGSGLGAAVNTSALLQVNGTDGGIQPPVMTTTQRNAIAPGSTDIGLMVGDQTLGRFCFWDGDSWNCYGAETQILSKEVTVVTLPNTSGLVDNGFLRVPTSLSGWRLRRVDYGFISVPTSGTDYVIQLNLNNGASTGGQITIQASQTAFEGADLPASFQNLTTGDLIRLEVVTAGTAIPVGLTMQMTFTHD